MSERPFRGGLLLVLFSLATIALSSTAEARRHRHHHRGHGHYHHWPAIKSGNVKSSSGAAASVNPAAAGKFQCLIAALDGQGYRIDFMGGYGRRSFRHSKHPAGLALDINQVARNRVTRHLPGNATALAEGCGLLHGAVWRHADAGHFEVVGAGGYRVATAHHHRHYARAY